MSEEEKQEEAESEAVEEAVDSESSEEEDNESSSEESQKIPEVEEAKKISENLKAENDRKQKLIEREEKLIARREALNQLGGGSKAGSKPAEKKELSPMEYRKQIEAGILPESKK